MNVNRAVLKNIKVTGFSGPLLSTENTNGKGLEGAVVDHTVRAIGALETGDERKFQIKIAGPAALLVAKLHKIFERVEQPGRANDKDAYDILRILRATDSPSRPGGVIVSATPPKCTSI